MDIIKIGKFIAEKRKEKKLTQEQCESFVKISSLPLTLLKNRYKILTV